MQAIAYSWILLAILCACRQDPRDRAPPAAGSNCCLLNGTTSQGSDFETIDADRLASDLAYQRQSSWMLFQTLLGRDDSASGLFHGWYSEADLGVLFQGLYSRLSKDQRRVRQAFSLADLDVAIDEFEQEQGKSSARRRIERWIETSAQANGNLERILFNRSALVHLLANYAAIHSCFGMSDRSQCPALSFPNEAAFIKTAWRRSGDGFLVEAFRSDEEGLRRQFEQEAWTSEGRWIPGRDEAMTLTSESGAAFHLAGLHFIVRFPAQWLWASFWLTPAAKQPLASDQPKDALDRWRRYQLCTIHSFEPTPLNSAGEDLSPELLDVLDLIQAQPQGSWCSNPFLEFGSNNQKTNCIGCHQFAGFELSQRQLADKLRNDLPSLLQEAAEKGPADFVWSLVTGPNALALTFAETIEYFDAYDPYEKRLEEE